MRRDRDDLPRDPDDRPPICPACGVTMGLVVAEDGSTRFVCLECGYPDDDGWVGLRSP